MPPDVPRLLDELCEAVESVGCATVTRGIVHLTSRADTSFEALHEFCQRHRELLFRCLGASGAVLFRGFPIASASDYEVLTAHALGLREMKKVAPDSQRASEVAQTGRTPRGSGLLFDLPPADIQMQGPHVEDGYTSARARYISFWCDVPPTVAGETALFDMSESYRLLDDRVRNVLDDSASVFPAYNGEERVHSVLVHPDTDERCLSIWYYQTPLADYAVEAYRKTEHHRNNPIRSTIPYVAVSMALEHHLAVGERRFTTTPEDKRAVMDAVYKTARYVEWGCSDLLLIDNIRFAHARMPCAPPRRIVVGYWNKSDMRRYAANSSVVVDDPVAFSLVGQRL